MPLGTVFLEFSQSLLPAMDFLEFCFPMKLLFYQKQTGPAKRVDKFPKPALRNL